LEYVNDIEKIEALRKQMPATTKVHYLNNGTNGPIPKAAYEAMKAEADKEFYEGRYLPFLSDLYNTMDDTRKLLGQILGASYEEIALTQSTTESLNIVFWGLNLQPGDEVIVTNSDHTSAIAPLAQVKMKKGITVKFMDVDYGDEYSDEKLLNKLSEMFTPRTRLVVFPHVSFTIGLTFPLKKIVDLCHDNKIMVMADGAQSAGATSINLNESKIDFYAIAGRKWLLGPEGIGALYIRKDRIPEVDPIFISPCTIKNRHDIDINSPYIIPAPFAARYQIATAMYMPTLLGFKKSLEFLIEDVGVEWAIKRINHLSNYVKDLIKDLPGVRIITPAGKEAGFMHFHVDGWKPSELCKLLNEKKFMVRPVPEQHLPAPIRISTGFYVTEEELELFAEELKKIIT